MKRVVFLLSSLFLLASAFPASACKCVPMAPLDSLSQLQSYHFIARVVITNDNGDGNKLGFKVIELFKGPQLTEVLEGSRGTSCDLGIQKNQEWILFATLRDGKIWIDACNRNIEYLGAMDLLFGEGSKLLDKLRSLYNKPAEKHPDGVYQLFYPDRKVKLEEHYLNNALNGDRSTFYPDGKLMTTGSYKNGQKEGLHRQFTPSGQLRLENWFRNGKPYNISRFYNDTTGGNKPGVWMESVYLPDGTMAIFRQYDRDGNLSQESIFGPDSSRTSIFYFPDGKLKEVTYDSKDKQLFESYLEDGTPKPARKP
ncbi:hypothetical protein ACWKWU_21245 [Chitinophaga lutea]